MNVERVAVDGSESAKTAPRAHWAFGLAMIAAAITGCSGRDSGDGSPRQRLTDYITVSFSTKPPPEKDKLLAFLTGNAKTRLSSWSDDQFRAAFVDAKRTFVKLTIRDQKKINDNETNVTYELSYMDQGRGNDARVTHKRLAEMILQDGKWYIRDVQNIREMIEYKEAMSLP